MSSGELWEFECERQARKRNVRRLFDAIWIQAKSKKIRDPCEMVEVHEFKRRVLIEYRMMRLERMWGIRP